jgi:tRNA(fMet)-specific endonuclease VapC
MATALYLLDLAVLAELTRPAGNRRVQTLFREHQRVSAIAAPIAYALLRGVESTPEGARRTQLAGFAHELIRSGPPVLPFDREAAVWLAREAPRRARQGRHWTPLEGQQAAIAVNRELVLVTRTPATYAGTQDLRTEDWFRP